MNKIYLALAGALLLAAPVFTDLASAQAKKKPAVKKPAAKKPAAKAGGPVVLGTQQLPGDFGKLGTTYTIGKRYPINFTLKSADYTTIPIEIRNRAYVPRADQKLLVLHYSVQNPTPTDLSYYWGDITFTAVDAKDVNHKFVGNIAREGTTDELNLTLKPAQKIDVYTALLVPAAGEVPKLIVEREMGAPVIRYDLRGKVKGVPAPYADPADSTGATARAEIPASIGTYYNGGEFDIRLDSVGYTNATIGGREPGDGKRFFTAIFTIKNRTTADKDFYWGYFAPELIDADGEKVAYNQYMAKATRDEAASGTLKPGEEARVRFFFPLPDNVAAKTLKQSVFHSLSSQHARTFAFDVSSAQ